MTQTLGDGTHIVQKMNGNVARDSEGRTRQDAPLPTIGNLSAANAPHIVFLQDPVVQVVLHARSDQQDRAEDARACRPFRQGDFDGAKKMASGSGSGAGPVLEYADEKSGETRSDGTHTTQQGPDLGIIMMQRHRER